MHDRLRMAIVTATTDRAASAIGPPPAASVPTPMPFVATPRARATPGHDTDSDVVPVTTERGGMATDLRMSVDISNLLGRTGYALVPGRAFVMSPHGQAELTWLRHRYAALPLDRCLPDGGTYRYRRHGRFTVSTAPTTRAARVTYHPPPPPTDATGWRHAPLGFGLESNCFLTGLLTCNVAQLPYARRWDVNVHMVRVTATPGRIGKPSPCGAHQDGADFVSLHLINLSGTPVGGAAEVHTPDGELLLRARLHSRLDSLYLNDQRLLHDITPIAAVVGTAHYDVLLITYRGEAA